METAYSEKHKIVTAKRLKELRNEQCISHTTLKAKLSERYGLDISKDSLMKYEVDDIHHTSFGATGGMSAEKLFCLAKNFGVSVDYLLGNIDIKNPAPQMQAACAFTGLSESAISIIKDLENGTDSKQPLVDMLNTLFKEGIITSLTKALENFVLFTSTGKLTFSYTRDKPKAIPIDPKIIAEWFLDMELNCAIENIKEAMLNKYSDLYKKEALP